MEDLSPHPPTGTRPKGHCHAKGEIRSTGDMRRAYPNEPWEKRLDQTIKRKLLKHCSGVGDVIESVDKKGYRLKLSRRE